MSLRQVRYFASVTSKVQRRRENLIKTKFPEYAGNEVSANQSLPRRGKRLGGLFADPSRPAAKLDGSEHFYDTENRQVIEKDFARRLRQASDNPAKLTLLMDEYTRDLAEHDAVKPAISEDRNRKIKKLASTDSKAALSVPVKLQPSAAPAYTRTRGKRTTTTGGVTQGEFPLVREEADLFAPSLESKSALRGSAAGPFWASHGASFIELNGTSVPSVVSTSLAEYGLAKTASVMFDESYRQLLTVTGQDAALVMDHFVTAAIAPLKPGDSTVTCIVDTKGYILTTAVVTRSDDSGFSIIMDGNNRESVYRYLAQYVVYSRQSGMDVAIRPETSSAVLSIHGPDAGSKLTAAFAAHPIDSITLGSVTPVPSIALIEQMPNMSSITVALTNGHSVTIQHHTDYYILIFGTSGPSDFVTNFLRTLQVPCGGAYALDMVRMEQGVPRCETDLPTTTPVRASLGWTVDMSKVRDKLFFGHERIASELAKGVNHRRVGLVASKYVYGGCRVLSAPHRYPIGEVTSCAWSPILRKRVCQAYIKPEYVVDGNAVLINVPNEVPDTIDVAFKKRITKQGAMQNVFRKLVSGKIISFPITSDTDHS